MGPCFPFDCRHCQKCHCFSYRHAHLTYALCPLARLNSLLLTSWMTFISWRLCLPPVPWRRNWNKCSVFFFFSDNSDSWQDLWYDVLSGSLVSRCSILDLLSTHLRVNKEMSCYWFLGFHGTGSVVWVTVEHTCKNCRVALRSKGVSHPSSLIPQHVYVCIWPCNQ